MQISSRIGAGLRGRTDAEHPPNPSCTSSCTPATCRRPRALYTQLCGWRAERIQAASGSYLALELGSGFGGGIVECETRRPVWLPYVEVREIGEATERARELGAQVLLEPREGPAGLAQRGGHAGGRRDRLLAAEATAPMSSRV